MRGANGHQTAAGSHVENAFVAAPVDQRQQSIAMPKFAPRHVLGSQQRRYRCEDPERPRDQAHLRDHGTRCKSESEAGNGSCGETHQIS